MGYFFANEEGQALAGAQDNKTFSGLFSMKAATHTFNIGVQKVAGNAGVQRISGTSGTSLANDSFAWSYDGKHEKSWQVRYDYNFAGFGVLGLSMMNRFIKGTHVHYGDITDGEDRGRELELSYVIQSGHSNSSACDCAHLHFVETMETLIVPKRHVSLCNCQSPFSKDSL